MRKKEVSEKVIQRVNKLAEEVEELSQLNSGFFRVSGNMNIR